jgi:predicted  nucleic acid-binding Zn-ribbon protein
MGMGQKISAHKVKRILEMHLAGDTQAQIASVLKINQSTVSLTIGKFKSLVAQYGLESAAKEYSIMDLIAALHDLGAELKATGISVEESGAGVKMVKLFQKSGVKPENYGDLIHACTKMKSDGSLPYAVKLAHLENTTGKTSEQLVNHFEDIIQQLPAQEKKLQILKSKVSATEADLASLENKKKAASQELEKHLKQVGLDMHRLELVEGLAIILKHGGVTDPELGKYVERQKQLNKAGISLETFIKLLEKVNVATANDGGKELLKLLSEYGGLSQTIMNLKMKIGVLSEQVGSLEEQAQLKGKLEGDVAKLKAEKASLEANVTGLHDQKDELEKVKGQVYSLGAKKILLLQEISKLETQKNLLADDIKTKEKQISDLKEQNGKYQILLQDFTEVEEKVKNEKNRWEVFEGFLGLVQSSSLAEIQKSCHILPKLVETMQQDTYSPDFLKNFILRDLVGPTFQVLKCGTCQARFYIDKPPPIGGYQCPMGGLGHSVVVDKDALVLIKAALLLPKQTTVIDAKPIIIKSPKTKNGPTG